MSTNQPPEQQIQQAINQVQQPNNGFPLEVAIPGTPQVFKGTTPQEVLDQLVRAQAEATATIRQAREEAATYKTQVEELKTKIPPPPVDATEAERQKYYQTWSQDPDEAMRLSLAKVIGVSPDKVADVLKRAIEGGVVNTAADEFLARCPDFPQTPQNAALIKQTLAERYGTSMEAATADNLELVYHQLRREGKIVPNNLPIQSNVQPNMVIPNIRGGSAPQNPVNDILMQAHAMPIDKLKEVIDRLSVQAR